MQQAGMITDYNLVGLPEIKKLGKSLFEVEYLRPRNILSYSKKVAFKQYTSTAKFTIDKCRFS